MKREVFIEYSDFTPPSGRKNFDKSFMTSNTLREREKVKRLNRNLHNAKNDDYDDFYE